LRFSNLRAFAVSRFYVQFPQQGESGSELFDPPDCVPNVDLPALLSHKLPILYCRCWMTLRGTFRRKSLKTVRFLKRANTTLGHEKENVVQFAGNEFSDCSTATAKAKKKLASHRNAKAARSVSNRSVSAVFVPSVHLVSTVATARSHDGTGSFLTACS